MVHMNQVRKKKNSHPTYSSPLSASNTKQKKIKPDGLSIPLSPLRQPKATTKFGHNQSIKPDQALISGKSHLP
jgi:hypothetical protein